MFTRLAAPVAIVFSLAAAPAMADEDPTKKHEQTFSGEPNDRTFDQLDRNQDGKLDEDELNAWGSTAAGQGSEERRNIEGRTERMLDKFDHDDDGAITEDELDQGPDTSGEAGGSSQ
ncbi:MAG: hypothetical protein ACOCVV_04995 [Marinobacter sp.]